MRSKVWDIQQPRNKWERGFAHLEYLRVGLTMPIQTKITTSDDPGIERLWADIVRVQDLCSVCYKPCLQATYKPFGLCSGECDLMASIEEDSQQQGDND